MIPCAYRALAWLVQNEGRMKHTMRLPKLLFTSLLLAACGTPEDAELPGVDVMDNDPPLAGAADVRRDAPKADEIAFEGKADTVLPASYDIVSLQTPVRNQSRRGVCSIFSTIGLMESLYKKAGMSSPDFSEQYLQWSVKNQVGAYANTEGSSDSYNLRAISTYGIPLESAWPYQPDPWTEVNDAACKTGGTSLPTRCYTNGEPPAAARAAKMYKLPTGRWVSTSSIKNIIFEKRQGVVVGLDFFYQAWNHRRSALPVSTADFSRGIVRFPNATDQQKSRETPAGHSVQLVGWNDNLSFQTVDAAGKPVVDAAGKPVLEKGFFIFKNSWGTANFGLTNPKGAGYGYISYRYVSQYGSGYTADPPKL